MGIQGLSTYLETKECYTDINSSVNLEQFKYVYFDIQSLIYLVFSYTERIYNCLDYLIKSLSIKMPNRQSNEEIYKYINDLRSSITNSAICNFLFMNNPNFDSSNIDTLRTNLDNFRANCETTIKKIIIEEIESLIKKFKNLEECTIVYDGKPLISKLVEQINRRVPPMIFEKAMNELYKQNGYTSTELKFSRELISKDSDFSKSLIVEICKIDINNTSGKKINLTVVNDKDGEGEHIIRDLILEKIKTIDDSETGKFLFISPDSDVVILSTIINIKARKLNKQTSVEILKIDFFDFNSIRFNNITHLNLKKSITQLKIFEDALLSDKYKDTRNRDFLLRQYLVIFSLLGNDFIPLIIGFADPTNFIRDFLPELTKIMINPSCDSITFDSFMAQDNYLKDIDKFNFLAKFDDVDNVTINKYVLKTFFENIIKLTNSRNTQNLEMNNISYYINMKPKHDLENAITTFCNYAKFCNLTGLDFIFKLISVLMEAGYQIIDQYDNNYNLIEYTSTNIMSSQLYFTNSLETTLKDLIKNNSFVKYYNTYSLLGEYPDQYPIQNPINNIFAKYYLQGLQYVADLYFTGSVKNKLWYYPDNASILLFSNLYNALLNEEQYVLSNFTEGTPIRQLFDYTINNHEDLYNSIDHNKTKNSIFLKIDNYIFKKTYNNETYEINNIYSVLQDLFYVCIGKRYVSKCQIINNDIVFKKIDDSDIYLYNVLFPNLFYIDETGQQIKYPDTYDITDQPYQPDQYENEDYDGEDYGEYYVPEGGEDVENYGGNNKYYKKYMKYKLKYLKLKKLI